MRFQTSVAALFVILTAGHLAAQDRLTTDVVRDPTKAELVFADIENFLLARQKIAAGADAVETLQKDYLDRGTPGLAMFIEKYDLTAERIAAAMEKHPEAYARIADNLAALESQQAAYRELYGEIQRLIPDAVFPPTYFVVAGHRGIGSGSIEGPLISIEKDSPESVRDGLGATLVHEMVHMEQLAALGPAYFEIFNGPGKTLLALSVREGIATYFSELITGGSEHKNEAMDFLVTHEPEIWRRFREEMLGSETGEWLWSDPPDPDQPRDVGYAIGARIAEAYYTKAEDKVEAARELLGVTDYETLLARSGYAEQLAEP